VLVVLGSPDRQIGLTVDRVLGEEDVVVKSLAANYHNVAGLTGAGISGEGRVFLILDPSALIENLQEHNP
jgi:two-component system chemotaxis sensor kinase CheA